MNKKFIAPAILILTILGAITLQTGFFQTKEAIFFEGNQKIADVSVEIADNETERSKGLMFRESLCSDCGMLFVYDEAAPRAFWMKNTLIPLDMIFISEDMRVLNVETAYPEPNKTDSELTRHRSEGSAEYVLEVNAGFAEEKGIEEGTRVRLD